MIGQRIEQAPAREDGRTFGALASHFDSRLSSASCSSQIGAAYPNKDSCTSDTPSDGLCRAAPIRARNARSDTPRFGPAAWSDRISLKRIYSNYLQMRY